MITQVPTLFIGIGGIGCQIAGAISDMLDESARDYVGFIGIDTDINSILDRQKEHHVMNYIQTSDDWNVEEYIKMYPEHDKWFPKDNILRLRKMLNGAGQVRALSRLTFNAAEKSGKFNPIFSEINRIRKIGNNQNTKLVIVIVGSITGGTGAGMFIELPLLIRNNLRVKCGVSSCTIRGMFVGPDITEDIQPEDFMKDSVCVNGYSCLKELNAFNIHHIEQADMPDEVAHSIEIENYDSYNMSPENVPYDYLYLYENSSNIGTIGDAKLEEIIKYISHIAYSLLFTPIGQNAASVEDNYILDSIRQNMLNRYVGAGVCRLIFPLEKAREFVTVSLVKDLVEKEWLILDNRYRAQNKMALERRETDHTVELPKLQEVYVDEFEKETKDTSGSHLLAKYTQEAYIVDEDKYISKADLFIQSIDDMVEDLMDTEEVVRAETACKVNEQSMKDFNLASSEVDRVWNAMRKYVQLAERLKNDKPNSFAGDFFPYSQEAMILQKNSSKCIYSYLATVHPLVARFLIYDLINKLSSKIEELNSELYDVNLLAYKQEDFDAKAKGAQTPAEALSKIREGYNPLWRMLGFIGDAIHSEEDEIKAVKTKLNSVSTTHIQTVHENIENSIKCSVYSIVLDRLRALSREYEKFFSTIETNIENNNNKLHDLANIYWAYGEDGVYCTREAFERMAEEFKTYQGSSLTMSEDTKEAVFEELFSIQAKNNSRITSGIKESMAERNRREAENKIAMEAVFDKAIVATVRQSVIDNGRNTVNLTVKEAIEKEYNLMGSAGTSLQQYINDRVNVALRIASPMITLTNAGQRNNELIFMAMSHINSSQSDINGTVNYYMGGTANNIGSDNYVNALIDDDFDNEEIVFIKISYGHIIEDLIKYGPGSRNAIAYENRIKNLGRFRGSSSNVEINPHLNRYWHEEGYIPAMQSEQRQNDKKDLVKAFIYGLGYDCFIKIPYQDKVDINGNRVYKWAVTVGASLPCFIEKHGERIGNDFIDLYNSLLFNGAIKKSILSYSNNKNKEFKGFNSSDMIANSLFESEFISDLVQADENKIGRAEFNMFDIFISMYSNMKPAEWQNLVVGLRNILWELFVDFFNGNTSLINAKTKEVLKEIYAHSSLSSTNADEYSESQDMLNRMYEQLINEDYE